jgi:hypothetical protein
MPSHGASAAPVKLDALQQFLLELLAHGVHRDREADVLGAHRHRVVDADQLDR